MKAILLKKRQICISFSGDCGEEVSHMGAADGEQSVIGELLLDLGPLTLCFSYQMDKRLPQYFGWLLH